MIMPVAVRPVKLENRTNISSAVSSSSKPTEPKLATALTLFVFRSHLTKRQRSGRKIIMTNINKTVDKILSTHISNAEMILPPSSSKPENNPMKYFIDGQARTFYFAKLKIEKAQSNVLADLKEENAKEKVDRDNDLIQMLDERSQYYKLSITNHEQTIQRLGNAYKEMTGEVWTAPRLKEKVQMKRPVYGSVRNYKNIALA